MLPVWSPRGDYIAFTKSYKKKFYIGLIKENGKGERLISEGYLADGPSWSPNGRTLAFYKIIKKSNNKYVSKLFTIDITGNIEKELLNLMRPQILIGVHQLSIKFLLFSVL